MFDDYARYHADLNGNDIAIITVQGQIPFWKFEADIRRAVHELGDLKAEPGQSVSVSVKSPYMDWVLNMALARMGVATAPPADIQSPFRVTDDAQQSGGEVLLLSREQLIGIVDGPERAFKRARRDPDALARLFRTSGTTGEPKRIAFSWQGLINNINEVVAWQGGRRGAWWVTTGEDTPFGYYLAAAALMCGYPAAIGMGPRVPAILKIKPRVLGLVPVHVRWLLDAMPEGHPQWPLTMISGGAGLPPELAVEVRRRLTSDVVSGYGATECGGIASFNLDLMEREPYAAGTIGAGVAIRLVDDQGQDVARGEIGQLAASNHKLAMGYMDDPEATARQFRDGWFYTTDLGRLREDGLLFIEGRKDELMNLGGHKVLPGSIDVALANCPGVKEGAAFAFSDRGIDHCGIAVVAGEGYDEAAVRAAAASKLMTVQDTKVMLVDSLPRNAMGKIERLKLRETMEGQLKPASASA